MHGLFTEIYQLYSVLSERIDDVHEQAGMRTSQVRLASTLARFERATVPDLAFAMNVSRQYVRVAINELSEDGLVAFMDNPRHRRSKLLELTERGQRKLKEVKAKESAIIQRSFPDVDAGMVKNASEALQNIRSRLDDALKSKGKEE